ncbi:MAG: glycine--tRNA ligase [Thermofilum sp. ex4484_15]|nr:MAG: glycine--tRNA ligase [Thermofilum sp. ex4484_15]
MEDKYEKISRLAKRRGFFWQSYEIYGGIGGFISLGPLGVGLKNNIIEKWREVFVKPYRETIVEIETPIITPSKVFEASGHIEHFTDYIVECVKCGRKFRADHLLEEKGLTGLEGLREEELNRLIAEKGVKCPECGGTLGPVSKFNLLFKTTIGPYSEQVGYARPETAQGMFLNFHRIYEVMGRKLPLGIAQIGRVMRNEISPRQGPIRLREFTIMEIELFFDPLNPSCTYLEEVAGERISILRYGNREPIKIKVVEALEEGFIANEWNAFFMALAKKFLNYLGIPDDKQMFVEKGPQEKAHYSSQTFDQVVLTERWGWVEVSGHAYRTDYDLKKHMEYSGRDLRAYRFKGEGEVRKVLQVKPIVKNIIRDFGKDKLPAILSNLNSLDGRKVVEALSKGGLELNIEGIGSIKLNNEHLIVVEREEKDYVERFLPHVAEPSFGIERLLYVVLEYSYRERKGRIILSLPKELAPIKVAVFPLVKEEGLCRIAKEIYGKLKKEGLTVILEEEGSIGKRYAKADEIGIPFAITVDRQSLEDSTVTVRDRDSWRQVRVNIGELPKFINRLLREGALQALEQPSRYPP